MTDHETPSAARPADARPATLLGRISLHLRRQHWTAIAIEFIAVVFGVLLGLQLNNWNQERLEAKQRAEIVRAVVTNLNDAIFAQEEMISQIDTGLANWEKAYAAGQKPIPYYFRIQGAYKAPAVWSTFEQMQLTDLFDPVTVFDLSYFYSELDGIGERYIRYATFVEDKVLPGEIEGEKAFYKADGSLMPEYRANMDRLRDFQKESRRQTNWARCLIYRLEADRTFARNCRRANYRLDVEEQAR